MCSMLEKKFKYQLKAQAHDLKPVVLLGAKGLTQAIIQETDHALSANELIKIKLTGVERQEKMQVVNTICEAINAHFVQIIGNIATIYRQKPEDIQPKVAVRYKNSDDKSRKRQRNS